jgi:hypothetical protein
MIIEYNEGKAITHHSLDNQIADANYYLVIAQMFGNTRNKKKWLKKIEQLEKLKENKQ